TAPSNIGTYHRSRFSFVPELGLTLNYQFTSWMRGIIGYNFMYWSDVMRPGDQIDRRVNVANQFGGTGVPQGNSPLFPMPINRGSDFWAHGLNIGLMFTF